MTLDQIEKEAYKAGAANAKMDMKVRFTLMKL